MGKLDGLRIAWCICGSYCNFENTLNVLKRVKTENDVEIIPVMTENAQNYDTRFAVAKEYKEKVEDICKNKILKTLVEVEPIGPKNMADIVVALPCTGNTMAKLSLGITDNVVLGAIKSIRRENKPVILAISSNDILGINFKNLGSLVNVKHIYFVPMKMDNPVSKPNSIIANFDLLEDTIVMARENKQIQPILL